ncbi:CHAT domain-containing protein [Hespellia stercorisuis]|nr:CHAT domain-containing protein [Hespellia stercorisuis]
MQSELITQLERLRGDVQKEKENGLSQLIMSVAALLDDDIANENQRKDNSNKRDEHNLRILSLTCLIVEIEGQLLQSGYDEHALSLKEDLTTVVELVQKCEYKWEMSKNVISDTIDLLCAVGWKNERILMGYLPKYISKSKRDQSKITPGMYFLFTNVATTLIEINENEKACQVLENLCTFSRRRNNINLHRELIVKVFSILGDSEPDIICKIGGIDSHIFDGEYTEYAGDFYWLYACCLEENLNRSMAGIFFYKCYLVRKYLYGEKNWYTAIAQRENAFLDFSATDNQVSRQNLLEFIEKVEHNGYEAAPSHDLTDIIMAKTIYIVLSGKTGQFNVIRNMSEYKSMMETFERCCETYQSSGEPLLSLRLAWNLRGNYYLQCNDYIQAEAAFQNALGVEADSETKAVLSDVQLKSNLLMIYHIQNDTDKSLPLLIELLDCLDDTEDNSMSKKDEMRLRILLVSTYIQSGIEVDSEELEDLKSLLHSLCELVVCSDESIFEYAVEVAMFIYTATIYLVQIEKADCNEQQMYLETLQFIERNSAIYKLTTVQQTMLYQGEALMLWNLGLPECERYIQKNLQYLEESGVSVFVKASMYQFAASFYGKHNNYNSAIFYIGKALDKLTETWHGYVRYSNDTRLLNILTPVQLLFGECYAILRKHLDVESVYERLLQFKAVASLAGRERNSVIQGSTVDSELIKQMNQVQNQLACMEADTIFQDITHQSAKLEEKLRELEKEFAIQFPQKMHFVDITWDRVKDAIPDNAVILEYYVSVNDYGRTQFDIKGNDKVAEIIDLYVTIKENGKVMQKRYLIDQAVVVIEKAERFISIFQEMSCNGGVSEKERDLEDLRNELYCTLIKPAILDIGDNQQIYIAPDNELVNLPFELLYEEECLEKNHQIIKIESARDFLFSTSDAPAAKGSLVIGNPQYEIREQQRAYEQETSSDLSRAVDIDLAGIEQLPFAEIESERVSEYLHTVPFIGDAATKHKVLETEGYQNLHIATHGFFDLSRETDVIYSSCLLFAGVKNWIGNGQSVDMYGNGIVTADEISRLNLKSMKLVVLSSCMNGRNDSFINKGFQGMVGAFAAAGVDYVIAHLWNVPDCISTVILMDTFYYYYVEENISPPLALAKAKDYLKTLSIDKMRRQGWFNCVRNSSLNSECKESVSSMEKYDDKFRPFKNEMFWGGFSCYQCN